MYAVGTPISPMASFSKRTVGCERGHVPDPQRQRHRHAVPREQHRSLSDPFRLQRERHAGRFQPFRSERRRGTAGPGQ
jgi:hypothetical protein